MKTEKRLTMALSVLVALMMLAVPLASSSNLFVDGGQTNSNGDAPLLGADAPSKNDYVEIKDVYVINSVEDLKKLPIDQEWLKKQPGYTNDTELGKSIPCLITVYTAKDGVVVGNKVTNDNMNDGQYHLEFTVGNGTTQFVEGYSGLTPELKDTKGNYYYILPLNGSSNDSEKLSIDKASYYQKYTVTAQLKDKIGADFSTKLSVDSAVDSITIDEVWMIDDQNSFEKIKNDYKKDLKNYIDEGKWNKVGNDERKPWVAVAFTATSPGTYNITFSYTDADGKSVPVSLDRSVSAAGQYVFVATVGNDQDGGTGDKLDITEKKVWGNNTYNVRITSADKVSVGSVTYGNVSSTYDVIFKLNADDKSLDIPVADIPAGVTGKVSWSKNADGDLVASVTISDKDEGKVSIEYLITKLFTVANIDRDGYTLTEWSSDDGNYIHMSYDDRNNEKYSETATVNLSLGPDKTVDKNMTFTATWELMEGYVEVPVHVYQDDVLVGDFIKTYEISEKNTIFVESTGLTSDIKNATGINTYGIIVNDATNLNKVNVKEVYSSKVTYGSDNDLPADGTIASNSELTVNYNLNDRLYSKVTVHSEAFKDGKDVTLFALKGDDYSYYNVFVALQQKDDAYDIKATIELKDGINLDNDKNAVTSDSYYLLTGWNNGAELLDSSRNAPAELTLDSKLNGYYVIFMVNSQFEVVYVPYGELSADKCTIASGVKYWSYVTYAEYINGISKGEIKTFSFTKSQIDVIEDIDKNSKDPSEPIAVFIGSEYSFNNTAYAVFDASENDGNFGNKYVDKIIVSGKASGNTKTTIPLPEVSPVYENTVVLVGYEGYTASGDGASIFGPAENIKTFSAIVIPYKYTITFYNGSDVNGIFYYGDVSTMGDEDITPGLVAFSYNGTAYDRDNITDETAKEIVKNFNKVLFPAKDGYKVTQWKDADGNVMLDKVKTTTTSDGERITYEVKFKKVSSDMSFYANFEALPYSIYYVNTYESTVTMPPQTAYVDKAIDLYKEAIFVYEGYKLIGWNTSPDGSGTSYALGASFTLTGEQYEDLKDGKVVTLYAVWEKVGGSTPGDNTDGGNDNTALYLIAGMLAIIAILAIVGILLMRKK